MTPKTAVIFGSIIIPVLLAVSAGLAHVVNTLTANSARDAVTAHRVDQLESYTKAHSESAARIEATVTQMRIDQATFMGTADTRIKALEGKHRRRKR